MHVCNTAPLLLRVATCRYLSNSTVPTEFAVDNSNLTVWRSAGGDSPVTFIVGLNTSITLSKVFVTFQSPSPYRKAVLQFLSTTSSEWMDLQYYAENCSSSFEQTPNLQ